jgi:hypothetical protein
VTNTIKLYLWGAVVVVLLVGYAAFIGHERQVGALNERNKSLLAEDVALRIVVARDDKALLRKDTAVVFRKVLRVDTLLQDKITESIRTQHDTILVTREVLVEAKAALDSTKGVADACCTLARDWKARWQVTDSLYRNTQKLEPSGWAPHLGLGAAAGVNYQGKLDAVAGLTFSWKLP